MHLSCEIAIDTNDLLQPQLEPATLPLDDLPEDVAEDLPDGGDQGLLCVVRGSVDISPRYVEHKIFLFIKITRARRRALFPLGPVSVEDEKNHCTKGIFHPKNVKFALK